VRFFLARPIQRAAPSGRFNVEARTIARGAGRYWSILHSLKRWVERPVVEAADFLAPVFTKADAIVAYFNLRPFPQKTAFD